MAYKTGFRKSSSSNTGNSSRKNSGSSYRGGKSNNSHSSSRNGGRSRSRGRRSYRGGRRKSSNNTTTINPQKYISKAQPIQENKNEQNFEALQFSDLALHDNLLENLNRKGFTSATEIQTKAIPAIVAGQNVLGISSTGSGKTGAFLIPMVNKILTGNNESLLVVAPTRELAMQIEKEAISLVLGTFIRVTRVIGGESMGRQISQLKRRPHIVIGTPGRINDMAERGVLKLQFFNNIVLDEVDRMLDMGFVHDITKIYNALGQEKQALFFSATIDNRVEKIISSLVSSYESFKINSNTSAKNVNQDVIRYSSRDEKVEKLHVLLIKEEVTKTIVFIETKRYVDKVERELQNRGFKAVAIHGGKTQGKRKSVLRKYRDNHFNVLIATNVAARGLDVDDISHVINFDEPQTYDEYIHRIGRTGRNGRSGTAYTFVQGRR